MEYPRFFGKSLGFTLVELLLALVLIGIISVISAPPVSSTSASELDRAESFLMETLRISRQEAIRTVDTCGVNIDLSAKRIRFYRYDASKTMAQRKVYSDDAVLNCLLHPTTKAALDQHWGSNSDFPKITLSSQLFYGLASDGSVVHGDIQFDANGLPWVFDGVNPPVPLATPDPTTYSPVIISAGGAEHGLTVCPIISRIVVKTNKDGADPCKT